MFEDGDEVRIIIASSKLGHWNQCCTDRCEVKNMRGPKTVAPLRILLDTNIWSEFANISAGPELLRVVRGGRVEIIVAPSVVFESLARSNDKKRQRQVDLLTLSKWRRLMPEAFSQCQEIMSEIRRLRPEWLKNHPNEQQFSRQRYDWTRKIGGFWDKVRYDTEDIREHLGIEEGWTRSLMDGAREIARKRRQQTIEQGLRTAGPLRGYLGHSTNPPAGCNDTPFQPWRWDAWASTSVALSMPRHPYYEWLTPFLNWGQVTASPASWNRFWFYEVDEKAMPRFWLMWAFEMLQSVQKVTNGTPGDSQLANYLPECDLVLSADANFIRNVDGLRQDAPCHIPIAERMPSGPEGVQSTLVRLERIYQH